MNIRMKFGLAVAAAAMLAGLAIAGISARGWTLLAVVVACSLMMGRMHGGGHGGTGRPKAQDHAERDEHARK